MSEHIWFLNPWTLIGKLEELGLQVTLDPNGIGIRFAGTLLDLDLALMAEAQARETELLEILEGGLVEFTGGGPLDGELRWLPSGTGRVDSAVRPVETIWGGCYIRTPDGKRFKWQGYR